MSSSKENDSFSPARLWSLVLLFGLILAIGIGAFSFLMHADIPRAKPKIEVKINSGYGARQIAMTLRKAGLKIEPGVFVLTVHLLGVADSLKAGLYEIPDPVNTLELVRYLAKGESQILSSVTLIEGMTAKEMLSRLTSQEDLKNDLAGLSAAQIAQRYDLPGNSLEGWIFPSTYKYAPGTDLSVILSQAIGIQQQTLAMAWKNRDSGLPLATPYDALKLASIVEKETGEEKDRPFIASVFINRLKANMPLQTDPTIIYGLGDKFDGNLTRKHLRTDGQYNTYLRQGLPPTPICNPGKASIEAVLHPPETRYYYFVAKGDGDTVFSDNLSEHNRAVRKYQLKK